MEFLTYKVLGLLRNHQAGIDSFKIEGRMKTALYVATVARTYRLAIDDFLKDPIGKDVCRPLF